MKKAYLAALMIASSLSVATTSVNAQETPDKTAISKINTTLSNMGFSDAQAMPEFQQYLTSQVKTSMIPVKIDRGIYLLADGGSALVGLGETSFVSGGSFITGADMLTNMTLEKSDLSAYPYHAPAGETKAELLVFTDPTCIYCKKVDEELQQYLDAGVKVTYLPFPRGGLNVGSPGYDKWVASACATDPAKAYHDVVMGAQISDIAVDPTKDKAKCEEMVANGYNLGVEVGVRGTPYMVLKRQNENNVNIAGYTPAMQLLQRAGLFK